MLVTGPSKCHAHFFYKKDNSKRTLVSDLALFKINKNNLDSDTLFESGYLYKRPLLRVPEVQLQEFKIKLKYALKEKTKLFKKVRKIIKNAASFNLKFIDSYVKTRVHQ